MKNRIVFYLNFIILGLIVTIANSCKEDELYNIKEVVIKWENPADVIDGVALSENELSATANVPGTMVFTPALGTVLPKGDNQELKAEFTPRDTDKYRITSYNVCYTKLLRYHEKNKHVAVSFFIRCLSSK